MCACLLMTLKLIYGLNDKRYANKPKLEGADNDIESLEN